jgi:hypothetical protein
VLDLGIAPGPAEQVHDDILDRLLGPQIDLDDPSTWANGVQASADLLDLLLALYRPGRSTDGRLYVEPVGGGEVLPIASGYFSAVACYLYFEAHGALAAPEAQMGAFVVLLDMARHASPRDVHIPVPRNEELEDPYGGPRWC